MGKIKHLSAEWEEWVLTNIARGVPPGMLVEDMVNKDFDRAFATSSVMQRAGLRVANDSANEGVTAAPSRIAPANHIDIDGHRIHVTSRIDVPDVVVMDTLLSERECDELIALSRPKLARSTTIDRDTGAEQVIAARSSEGAFFMRGENPLVSRIEQRLAALTGTPIENGEGLQILHYGTGGEYQPHFDFFEPEHAGSAAHLKTGGQRVSTIILYLNDVEAGGETIFPDITFAVTARKGAAVYFSYCDSKGELDRLTLHGGAPVTRGEKWIATKWLRQGPHR